MLSAQIPGWVRFKPAVQALRPTGLPSIAPLFLSPNSTASFKIGPQFRIANAKHCFGSFSNTSNPAPVSARVRRFWSGRAGLG